MLTGWESEQATAEEQSPGAMATIVVPQRGRNQLSQMTVFPPFSMKDTKTGCLVTYFSSSCSGLHDFTGQDKACYARGAHTSHGRQGCAMGLTADDKRGLVSYTPAQKHGPWGCYMYLGEGPHGPRTKD